MIIRSSADMVDLLLFSLGQAETLGRMTTPVGVNLGTLHRHHIMFRNGNNPSEGFKNNSNKAIRERKKKKKVIDHWSRGRAGRNGEENGSAQGGLGVLVLYLVSYVYFFFYFYYHYLFYSVSFFFYGFLHRTK